MAIFLYVNPSCNSAGTGVLSVRVSGTRPLQLTVYGPGGGQIGEYFRNADSHTFVIQQAADGTALANGVYTLEGNDGDGSTTSTTTAISCGGTPDPEPQPVYGCTNPEATNYNPNATEDDGSCILPEPPQEPDPQPDPSDLVWRSAWQTMAVRVLAEGNPLPSFLSADLTAGPALAALGVLRATVGPDGYATFHLGPYLRPELGAELVSGQRRLDLNSVTALTDDLLVAYELRSGPKLLEAGLAVNSAVADELLTDVLTPFPVLPLWPGFAYEVSRRDTQAGRIEAVGATQAGLPTTALPCPPNALPVRWLAPGGGFGYWVFAGRPQHSDVVGEGRFYQEAQTNERRLSSRAPSYRRVEASSEVFSSRELLVGLRTLRYSPQAWYQPVPEGDWVPILLESGTFPAYREGVRRYEFSIAFTEAKAVNAQGQ